MAMVEPGTGEVKALAQSRPMGRSEARRDLPQLHGADRYGDSAGFQAGSTFKAFVLAAAIEKGFPLAHDIQLAAADVHPQPSSRTVPAPATRPHV